jgi:predicted component of type VI protein secretion system
MDTLDPDDVACLYWLDHGGRRCDLQEGVTVIGRGAECDVVLDDALVSRRHAQIVIDEGGVRIEDLQSANGVSVNGQRIERGSTVQPGDTLTLGRQSLVLRSGESGDEDAGRCRFGAATLSGEAAEALLAGAQATAGTVPPDQELRTLSMLGGVADKVLALGRAQEAERVLAAFLEKLLTQVRAGTRLDPQLAAGAAEYAVKIAGATNQGRWVDYCIELYAALQLPMPAAVVDELYTVLRGVPSFDRNLLTAYVEALNERQESLGPNERFLVHRIQGLVRLAALK